MRHRPFKEKKSFTPYDSALKTFGGTKSIMIYLIVRTFGTLGLKQGLSHAYGGFGKCEKMRSSRRASVQSSPAT